MLADRIRARSSSAFVLNNSLDFAAGDRITFAPGSSVSATKMAYATYVKVDTFGSPTLLNAIGAGNDLIFITSAGKLRVNTEGTVDIFLVTTATLSTGTWYHIAVIIDTTQATASDRVKVYIDGVRITAFDNETYPALNFTPTYWGGSGITHYMGSDGTFSLDGHLAQPAVIFGSAPSISQLYPSKNLAGVVTGTSSDYWLFEDNTTVASLIDGEKSANSYSSSGIATTDQSTDVPT